MLQTKRLDLIPATLKLIETELRDLQEFGALLGARISKDWPPGEYDRNAMEFFRTRLAAEEPAAVGWYVWYGITRNRAGTREELIAGAGFFGPPSDSRVEIGFSVIPSARGLGYAREIIGALADYAFSSGDVDEIIAHTTDLNIPSIRALLGCGFQRIGPGKEPGMVQYRVANPKWDDSA